MHDSGQNHPNTDPSLSDDENALLDEMIRSGQPRRDFLKLMFGASAGIFAYQLATEKQIFAATAALAQDAAAPALAGGAGVAVQLTVNGASKTLKLDPRVVLLDALRDKLALTGTKKGCDGRRPRHAGRASSDAGSLHRA
jgi:xanthine dehydrogenase YagT iron-sulfur-binding subunit